MTSGHLARLRGCHRLRARSLRSTGREQPTQGQEVATNLFQRAVLAVAAVVVVAVLVFTPSECISPGRNIVRPAPCPEGWVSVANVKSIGAGVGVVLVAAALLFAAGSASRMRGRTDEPQESSPRRSAVGGSSAVAEPAPERPEPAGR